MSDPWLAVFRAQYQFPTIIFQFTFLEALETKHIRFLLCKVTVAEFSPNNWKETTS